MKKNLIKLHSLLPLIERGRSRIIPTSSMIKFDLKQGIWTHIQPKFGMLPTPRDKATSWIADERFQTITNIFYPTYFFDNL